MAELKPCPFCGCDKVKIGRKSALAGFNGLDERVENHTFSVRCNACHARGGAVSGKVLNYKYGDRFKLPEWATTDAALKTRAVCAWNRRSDDALP